MQITVILAVLTGLLVAESLDPGSPARLTAAEAAGLVAGSTLIAWSLMRLTSRLLLKRLERLGWNHPSAGRLPRRVEWFMRASVLSLYVVQLTLGGWAWLVCGRWGLQRPEVPLAGEAALVAPFVLLEVMRLWCFYPVNRAIREQVMMSQLAGGMATRPVWSRGQYMSFHVRHGLLIVLVPLGLIMVLKDVVELVSTHYGAAVPEGAGSGAVAAASNAVTGVGALVIFLLAPVLLRRIWTTRPLPAGPLRDKLERFCARLGLKYRELLLWDTYGAVGNAAMMGLLRPVRYVLLSDALVENMPDEQIEAVFGHEAGHAKHHHIALLVLFVVGSMLAATLASELITRAVERWSGQEQWLSRYGEWMLGGMAAGLGLGWLLLFGWVSRRFERQADLYGAWAVGSAAAEGRHGTTAGADNSDEDKGNSGNSGDGGLPREGAGVEKGRTRLNAYGAALMGAALQRIAVLNGISIYSRSWRHASIASRMAFLQEAAADRHLLGRFERSVRRLKAGIIMSVVAGAAGWWALDAWGTGSGGG